MRTLKYISFGAVAVLIVGMAAATVYEKVQGTEAAMRGFYHSPWFIALWAVVAVAGAVYFFRRVRSLASAGSGFLSRFRGVAATVGIHLAFLLILAGALITHVSGDQGTVRFFPDGGAPEVDLGSKGLPFKVNLESFEVLYYPGTTSAMDYVGTLEFTEPDGARTEGVVSMNNIFRYSGYRFYMASYAEDGSSVTLAVSHDPWGVGVTYSGYLLLLLSIIGFFFQKNSGFRAAVHRLRHGLAVALAVVAFAGSAPSASAAAGVTRDVASAGATRGLKVLPEETAALYGDLYVYYNDRVAPMQTLARDFTMKLYGSATYKGLSAEQVLTGWIFYYDSWRRDYNSLKKSGKAAKKAREREEVITLVCSGSLLRLFPYYSEADGGLTWLSATQTLPIDMDNGQWMFIRRVQSLVAEKVVFKKFDEAGDILLKIKEYQVKELAKAGVAVSDGTGGDGSGVLSTRRFAAEKLYNRVERPKPLFMLCLTIGLLLFLLSCIVPRAFGAVVQRVAVVLAVAVLLYLTFILTLRWYVAGHIPMSNGFETMLTLAWITFLLTCVLWRKFPLILPFGFLLGGFAILVASIGESDPKIANLMPVLSSPLLSIHVASMMISYSLFGITMLNALSALIKHYTRHSDLTAAKDLSLLILYPAVFCLTIGTFLGAVWANVSWGSYWAWDPKETWALITLLVYALTLHGTSLKPFRNPVFFHWFTFAAFLCVLITYFGVNFLLGGLHSYA